MKTSSCGLDRALLSCHTDVAWTLYISSITGSYQAQLCEEKRALYLASGFIGKCLFRVRLSAWLLLIDFHFTLLARHQLPFTSAPKQSQTDKKRVRANWRDPLPLSQHRLSSLSSPPLRIPPLAHPLTFFFRNHQLWGILPHSRADGRQEGGRDGDAEERQDAAAAGREEDGEAQSEAAHGWWLWVSDVFISYLHIQLDMH